MIEKLSQVEVFRQELAKRFIQQISGAIESGESRKLLEVMDTLATYLVESSGIAVPSKSFSELELLRAGVEKFTKRDLDKYPDYSFMGGTEGARFYFNNGRSGSIVLHFGKPSEDKYDVNGKYYEKFRWLFGTSDVELIQEDSGRETVDDVSTLPDKDLQAIDLLLPKSKLGEFLDSYDEAEKIVKNLIQLRQTYSRQDLERIVVDLIIRKFPEGEFTADKLRDSLKSGSLRGDYAPYFDFVDFVEGAFEMAQGKIVEPNLFEQTNALLVEKFGSGFEVDQLPDTTKGTESLAGKRIFMIDDQDTVLSEFIPPLMVATDGTAEFIHHTDQSVEEIVDLIMNLQPEIILLDNKLSAGIMGPEVANQLTKRGYTGKIIGFSTDIEPPKKFSENGVTDWVRKDTNSVVTSILSVAKLISANDENISS